MKLMNSWNNTKSKWKWDRNKTNWTKNCHFFHKKLMKIGLKEYPDQKKRKWKLGRNICNEVLDNPDPCGSMRWMIIEWLIVNRNYYTSRILWKGDTNDKTETKCTKKMGNYLWRQKRQDCVERWDWEMKGYLNMSSSLSYHRWRTGYNLIGRKI